ncbi:hypothetical protein COF68_06160 [Bacillus toyonensis]|uniref:hypothetical protein n=1 Tax=Bacillus toyonensis TaxID=155322 RepID=UPI000BFE4FE8|nr:hypothetical protein [Bacillus toyonensis]PHE64417.1 hypothetical protein COF68_06160 [Bacillus toyonensis]
MLMHTVTKKVALDISGHKGYWEGFIAPDRVNDLHIEDSWRLVVPIRIQGNVKIGDEYRPLVRAGAHPYAQEIELDKFLEEFKQLNCNEETGLGIRFWYDCEKFNSKHRE